MTGQAKPGRIRVGIGGWDYEPWRETFYPKGLPQRQELEYASRQLTAIEINGTFYRTQTPASFAKWREQTPDDFVFSVKAPRYATNRKALGEAGESIQRFMQSGLTELGDKLGPVVWQFAPTKRFEPEEMAQFLKLLPEKLGHRPLRHVLDVRHPSFMHPDFLALATRHRAATVLTDSDKYPSFSDLTADFVYARLMQSEASIPTGYPEAALEAWAERARSWGDGPSDDPPCAQDSSMKNQARDVYVFFINGAKERAPAAACRLLAALA